MRCSFAILVTASLLAGPALAETSSWSSRGDAAGTSQRRRRGRRRRKNRPAPAPKAPAASTSTTAPADDGVSSHAKGAPQVEDAAYEAFDQGRYLTALELAVKAAEAGDPQAHTLVGRIYGEGYGVAKNSALAAKWYTRGAGAR